MRAELALIGSVRSVFFCVLMLHAYFCWWLSPLIVTKILLVKSCLLIGESLQEDSKASGVESVSKIRLLAQEQHSQDDGSKSNAMSTPHNEQGHQQEADRIRQTEHARLRALVEASIAVATLLHADDFQLITPSGRSLSKAEYLGRVASGEINYLVWEPGVIEVRVQDQIAVIRYQSELEFGFPGETLQPTTTHRGHYWHMDVYEKHQGVWQVVWSQATEIQERGNQ